jgi:hypothetical protein
LSPVCARELCARAAELSGLRKGWDLERRILDAARASFAATVEQAGHRYRRGETEFFWEGEPGVCRRFRRPGPGEARDAFEVAFPELEALASQTVPGPGEEPVRLMGAALGLARMGLAVGDRLKSAWDSAGRAGGPPAGKGGPYPEGDGPPRAEVDPGGTAG